MLGEYLYLLNHGDTTRTGPEVILQFEILES